MYIRNESEDKTVEISLNSGTHGQVLGEEERVQRDSGMEVAPQFLV